MLSEKQIVIFSSISGVFYLIACICLSIVWMYWSDTLNGCPETNCGCVFYGHLRGMEFVGGRPIWCRILTFFTLIATIACFVVAGYFFIRLRNRPKNYPGRATPTPDTDSIKRSRLKRPHSTGFKFFCGIFTVLVFIHVCGVTEGYWTTCSEYRQLVAKYLKAGGDLMDLVNDRLSCGTAYDFMDYLHPDAISQHPYLPNYYHHRTFRINTGTLLIVSIWCLWLSVIIWIGTTTSIIFCR